jgi:hypothetical protein
MEIGFISGKFLMIQQYLAVMKLSHHIFRFISYTKLGIFTTPANLSVVATPQHVFIS